MIQIFKRADEKKRAKTELEAAQLKYNEAIKDIDEVKKQWETIFDSLKKSRHAETNSQ